MNDSTFPTENIFLIEEKRRPLVIAHRGGGGLRPENTMLAFQNAVDLGSDMLELDLHLTRDRQLVVSHDETIERCSDGKGKIGDFDYSELQRFDFGYSFSPDHGHTFPYRGAGCTIPTFSSLLGSFSATRFNVDLKDNNPAIVEIFTSLLDRMHSLSRVLVGSFTTDHVRSLRKIAPNIATIAHKGEVVALLAAHRLGIGRKNPCAAQAVQTAVKHWGITVVEPSFIDFCHQLRIAVQPWTIDDLDEMTRLIGYGVDGLTTDYPNRMLALLVDHEPILS